MKKDEIKTKTSEVPSLPIAQTLPNQTPESLSLSAVEHKDLATGLISLASISRPNMYNESMGIGLSSSDNTTA